eukprot:CAMPEP_0168622358 /NCGR_PEP_ID=MMETSP0449_2-20121227/8220_1 /TAXON_ID=1082188 /ORGANISM="Strombidium rassoulzadegani, Strain ras09" /LENGTH=44 /DNA_ID= /DNA_START= /DNA_END= /DNA_ORIENTATION=
MRSPVPHVNQPPHDPSSLWRKDKASEEIEDGAGHAAYRESIAYA